MLPGLILAAGDSSRMGTPKACLRDVTGTPFLVRIANTLREAGVLRVAVITGRHHDAIEALLRATPLDSHVRMIRNPDPSRGQLSSLLIGMDEVCDAGAEGLLVTLVDVPMISTSTVRQVVDAWTRTQAPIVRPSCDGRRGHPVIFGRSVFQELRRTPLEMGARPVVRAHQHESIDVPVVDRGCLIDVDTPDEYAELLRRHDG